MLNLWYMRKHTNKSPKLRDLICSICGKKFQNYISPSEILEGKDRVCSKECKAKLNSINNTKGYYSICTKCGRNNVWNFPSRKKKMCTECWKKRSETALSTDGYRINCMKKVHRTIMEEHIGRKLKSTEIIHHIDFNKLNNSIENLQIVSRSEHNKIHKFLCKKGGD